MMRCKPMLAYPVSDKPIDYSKPTFIQPKLDGVRCVIQLDHEANERGEFPITAYSRTGKEWKNIEHILEELLAELAKSMTLMNLFTDKEEYEKCSLLKTRIKEIKHRLKKYKDDEI